MTYSLADPNYEEVAAALHAAALLPPDRAALDALLRNVAADHTDAGVLSQGLRASTLCADMTEP